MVSFNRKFIACLTLSLLFVDALLLLGTPPAPIWLKKEAVFGACIVFLLIPFLILPIWQYRDRRGRADMNFLYPWIQTCIAWLTGFSISLFGWKKLFHLQFRTPLSIADLPMSSLSGETLTWYYFGHSYVFACIIGMLQITGSFLLFFTRTRLAGALLLLPVMLNILLVNIFYQMNDGALLQSILLTIGVLYIILSYYPHLKTLLFPVRPAGDRQAPVSQWMAACIACILSLSFVMNACHLLPQQSVLYGRYQVCNAPADGLARVYFDMDNVCVLEYGPQRRLIANYDFDMLTRRLSSRFAENGKKILLSAIIYRTDMDSLIIDGTLAGDSTRLVLCKMK